VTPDLITDIAVGVLLAIGSFFLIVGSIGLLRMPDVFTRMHATSVSDTMGAGFLILGMMVEAGFSLVSVKLAIILAVFFFTSPLATHALARGALAVGLKPVLLDKGGRRRLKELELIGEFGVVQARMQPPAKPAEPASEKRAARKTSRSKSSGRGKGGSSSKR
jgi:multicomponent Na+:H+ antiporter subunit G